MIHLITVAVGVVVSVLLACDEAVALQAQASHDDEDAEGGVTICETLKQRLASRPHEQVDALDAVAINLA